MGPGGAPGGDLSAGLGAAKGGTVVKQPGLLWGSTEASLEAALEAAVLRQRVIAHNLANVETPGYRRFEVVFEEALAAQQRQEQARVLPLARTHPTHLSGPKRPPVQPAVVRDTTSVVRNDSSNVDLEREMTGLAKNALFYQALTRVMAARLAALRSAIAEGRR